jgi:hypothetical protein
VLIARPNSPCKPNALLLQGLELVMTPAKRPVGVWLILAFYVLGMGFVSVELVRVVSYFPSLGVIALASIFVCALNVTGAILLFLLRKTAVLLFAIALVLSTAASVPELVNWRAIGFTNLGGAAIGLLISLAILLYAIRLRQRGILR